MPMSLSTYALLSIGLQRKFSREFMEISPNDICDRWRGYPSWKGWKAVRIAMMLVSGCGVLTVCVHSIGFNTGTQESEVRKKQYRCHAVYWTHPVLRRDRHMGNDQGANTLKKEWFDESSQRNSAQQYVDSSLEFNALIFLQASLS